MSSRMPSTNSVNCGVRWMTRLVPCFLLAIVVYSSYVVVGRICVNFLLRERNDTGLAAAFLVLYFFFLTISLTCYLRTLYVIKTEPGFVPLSPTSRGALIRSQQRQQRQPRKARGHFLGRPYDEESAVGFSPLDLNPDSPGLENFYTKDVFVCESDGRPKWCHECGQWKPDRASHSREVDRCVRKMDHFCPWVGGMVAEDSFKFFAQFNFYVWMLCAVALSTCAYTLTEQLADGLYFDGQLLVVLVLSGFLGVFSCAMAGTAIRFILKNKTNVDLLKRGMSYQLAVRVPLGTLPTEKFTTVTYPLPKLPAMQQVNRAYNNHAPNQQSQLVTSPDETPQAAAPANRVMPRDKFAQRTFAILRTEPGENPWDLGYKQNWFQIMGRSPLDWLLPIHKSPTTKHESNQGEYPFGPLIAELRVRYGLHPAPCTDKDEGLDSGERAPQPERRRREPRRHRTKGR